MIKQGHSNVRTVEGGGRALEKYFDYYRGGKVYSPATGRVTDLRSPLRR